MKSNQNGDLEQFFPVSIYSIQPNKVNDFRIYIKRGNNYVLLTNKKETFTLSQRDRLYNLNIETVYIPYNEAESYDRYLVENLDKILYDENIPLHERSKTFYNLATDLSYEVINEKLSSDYKFKDLLSVIDKTIDFLSKPENLESVRKLISHDYYSYTHSVNVFIYSTFLLNQYNYDKKDISYIGSGAFLHDIGKSLIPHHTLNKPGALNNKEWEIMKKHPEYGIEACSNLSLSHKTKFVIRNHHEKLDGEGYPDRIKKIPHYVQIVTCCDIFDALTTNRVYANKRSPFEAFKLMKDKMHNQINLDILATFIKFMGKSPETVHSE